MNKPDIQSIASQPPHLPQRKRSARVLVFLIKATLAAVLLYWLASADRLHLSQVRNIPWTPHTWSLVLLGAAGVWTGMILLGWRLRLMAEAVGISLPLRRAVSLTAIGLFTGSILPGVVGGDVVKAVYLCRGEAACQRTKATVAIICDRVLGLFALFLLGSLALAAAWATHTLPFWSPFLLSAPLVVVAVFSLVALYARLRFGNAPHHVAQWGRRLPERLRQAAQVGDTFLRQPRLLAVCIGLSLLNHLLVCCTFLLAAKLLTGVAVSPLQQFLLNPLAMIFNTIPVTPGGVGVTESAFSYLYEAASCSIGATIGILGRAIQYLAIATAGLPAFLFRSR